MNIPSKWRSVLYVVAAAASVIIGVLTALGIVSQDQVAVWFATAGAAFTGLTSLLALLNVTPDIELKERQVMEKLSELQALATNPPCDTDA